MQAGYIYTQIFYVESFKAVSWLWLGQVFWWREFMWALLFWRVTIPSAVGDLLALNCWHINVVLPWWNMSKVTGWKPSGMLLQEDAAVQEEFWCILDCPSPSLYRELDLSTQPCPAPNLPCGEVLRSLLCRLEVRRCPACRHLRLPRGASALLTPVAPLCALTEFWPCPISLWSGDRGQVRAVMAGVVDMSNHFFKCEGLGSREAPEGFLLPFQAQGFPQPWEEMTRGTSKVGLGEEGGCNQADCLLLCPMEVTKDWSNFY